ncbi:hypothetical protein CFC21_080057 [Triticum aestivum]|uniref:F-box domain-containing protein n=3 Tax=Triticinae TaxID=1648030 RepID=A0A3B6MY83_WHEAT|nr:F-box protein At5g07610-like [Aegilops tauschii subsp. strangulata]XP_044402160.1 F-box protein At5g07610-like [Triticum aestivum]KAF7075274.1 hypothetical protein CFC21_080057 [Triticum aestivum]
MEWNPGYPRRRRGRGTRRVARTFSRLSDDLLVEIISRVPFKSTRCCKCVCRRWRDVVSNPDHRKKLPRSTLAGFFYRTGHLCCRTMNRHYKSLTGKKWCRGIDPALKFLPKYRLCDIHIDMLDCCNGLLLCRRQQTDYHGTTDYVVCNPATKTWIAVPGTDRSRELRVARLGFDPVVSSHFRVLEFAPTDDNDTHVKPLGIYSSEAGAWTHRSDWKCPIDINKYSSSAFFRGVLYLSSYEDKVVAVDLEGNCRVIHIPTLHDSCIAREVYVSQGQLYVVISSDSELSMWALEDSSTENWTLKHNLSHLQLFGAEDSSYEQDYDIIIHPECNLIFILLTRFYSTCRSATKLMSYDMDSRTVHSISDFAHDWKSPYLSYVPLFSGSLADGQ